MSKVNSMIKVDSNGRENKWQNDRAFVAAYAPAINALCMLAICAMILALLSLARALAFCFRASFSLLETSSSSSKLSSIRSSASRLPFTFYFISVMCHNYHERTWTEFQALIIFKTYDLIQICSILFPQALIDEAFTNWRETMLTLSRYVAINGSAVLCNGCSFVLMINK